MKFDVLTLFPEMFDMMQESVIGRAIDKNLIEINSINMRDFSKDKHKKVDDTVYGGGAGMLIRPDVVWDSYQFVKTEKAKVIYLTPQGKTLTQEKVLELAKEELSIGDYVLTGGELPAMVLIDCVSRYVEGVLSEGSTEEETFSNGLLEYPQYTRPEVFEGEKVPEVLLSGHHENIKNWRKKQAFNRTMKKRPDLLEKVELSDEDKRFLEDFEIGKKED